MGQGDQRPTVAGHPVNAGGEHGAALDHALQRGDRGLALSLVRELAWPWYLHGHHAAARDTIARALAISGDGGDAASASAWAAGFAILAGEDGAAPEGAGARARWFVAHARLHAGDAPAAGEALEPVLTEFGEAGDRWGEAASLASRAGLAALRGDLATGVEEAERSLALFTALGDGWGGLHAGDRLAHLAALAGDHGTARRRYRDGVRAAGELGLPVDVPARRAALGRLALLAGEEDGARESFEAAMTGADPFAEQAARVGLAQLARHTGDLDGAEAHLRAALAWYERVAADRGRPPHGVTVVLTELGFVADERGDAALATSLHERALTAARDLGDPRAEALAHDGLAGAAALDGDRQLAWSHLTQAIRLRGPQTPLPPAERRDVERIVATLTRRPAGPRVF